jgi:ribonuclease P protein component
VVDGLFAKSTPYLNSNGFRFTYLLLPEQESHCQVLFTSPRKKLKTAVLRNRRKRLLRELYRLNKGPLLQFLVVNGIYIALSIHFVGAETLDFHSHTPKFQNALQQLILELQKNNHRPLPAIG